jgi:glucose-6-phosphate 1-dehydrogenase
VIRGQFRGYREERGVAPDSQVETYAALRLHIDTWRWAGVPFYLRAGKCLPVTATEVVVNLKAPPLPVFGDPAPLPNYYRFRLSPDVVIGCGAAVKQFGETMQGESVELIARHESRIEMSPYERLLSNAIAGDTSLFTRDDAVEAAWRVVDPILGAATPVIEYAQGTWGPRQSDQVISGIDTWHNPVAEKTPT